MTPFPISIKGWFIFRHLLSQCRNCGPKIRRLDHLSQRRRRAALASWKETPDTSEPRRSAACRAKDEDEYEYEDEDEDEYDTSEPRRSAA